MNTKTLETDKLIDLVRQLNALKSSVMDEMKRKYPVGTRVVFWRSSNQKKESFGTVVSHSLSHGPELRVKHDNSHHVVGLHIGYTRFDSI